MINKDSSLPFDKICRSCMTETSPMRSVYEANTDSVQLAEMIMACAAVQVVSGDGLPALICSKCEEHLNVAYIFKQQTERTDAALREYTNQPLNSSIKEESESLDIVVKPDIELEIYDDDVNDDPYSDSDSAHSNYSTTVTRKKKKKAVKSRQCKYCNKILATKEGLKLHERRHTGEKLKSCPVCHATFAKSNHLIRHMQMHNKPTDEYKHTCQECGMGFTKAFHLAKHKKEHKNQVGQDSQDSALDTSEALDESEVKNEVDSEPEPEPEVEPELEERKAKRAKKESIDSDKLHPCKICMKSFTKTSHLNRHMVTHGVTAEKSPPKEKSNEPKEKKFMACEFCDRKFVYKKSFLHHIQLEHQIEEDSDTPLSEYATIIIKPKSDGDDENGEANKSGIKSEGLSEEGMLERAPGQTEDEFAEMLKQEEAKKLHTCHVCNHKFTRANHLTRHMTLHRAVLVHKCDRCEKAFMTPDHLAKHVQEYHVDRPYVCSLCNKPFSRGEHLIRHLKVHDKDPENKDEHKCSICEKVFSRSDHLARHTKLHLAQDKRHVCNECGKAFNRLDNLRTHSRIHTGVRDPQRLHLCIYCGKEFNNSSNMIVHMRRHTGERPYKCDQCGKGFPRSHDLKCHERTHSGEKPYLCTLCGKSFNKSNKLLRHTRVHTGERPYVCSLCGRAFTQSNDLSLHMRRHTGSRPYACGMCPARFIQSGQLKAHRRSQGHWLEVQPELKGAHRVTPVTPVTNPAPIKFKTRVHKIKQEGSQQQQHTILGHTIGLNKTDENIAGTGGTILDKSIYQGTSELAKNNEVGESAILEKSIYQGASGLAVAAFVHREANKDMKLDEVHNFSVTNLSRDASIVNSPHLEHRPTTSSGFQTSVEPSTSFSNNITMTSNTYTVSEGYSYQSYG